MRRVPGMRILIVGGTRFLGYHLTRRLLEDGHAVTLFNRGKTPDDFGDGVERIRGDRADRPGFRKAFAGRSFDAAVDMIAYTAEDSRSAAATFSGKVGHFVHISTAAVYLVTRDYPCPLREEDSERPLGRRPSGDAGMWDYGIAKRGCEEVLCEAHARDGFPATLVRPPIIVGERDHTLRAYSYLLRLRDGKPIVLPDGGQSVFSLAYQGDIVRAVAGNLGNAATFGKVYNVAHREALTLKGFLARAAAVSGASPDFVPVPYDVLRGAGWRASLSPYFNRRPLVIDIRRAEAELGLASTSVETWLERTIRWFAEDYRGEPPDDYRFRDEEVRIIRGYQKALSSLLP
jgi:nucleoside-diphosphate-sugar epimerase